MKLETHQVERTPHPRGQTPSYCAGCDVPRDGVLAGGCGSVPEVGQDLEHPQSETVHRHLVPQSWDESFLNAGKSLALGNCVETVQCVPSAVPLYFIEQFIRVRF